MYVGPTTSRGNLVADALVELLDGFGQFSLLDHTMGEDVDDLGEFGDRRGVVRDDGRHGEGANGSHVFGDVLSDTTPGEETEDGLGVVKGVSDVNVRVTDEVEVNPITQLFHTCNPISSRNTCNLIQVKYIIA